MIEQNIRIHVAFLSLAMGMAPLALAQEMVDDDASSATPSSLDKPSPLTITLSGGAEYQFDTDFEDDGGDYTAARFNLGINAAMPLNDRLDLNLSLGYAHDAYDFSGTSGFAALDPWDAVNTVQAAARLEWEVNDRFTLFGGPIIGFSAESGAHFGDSVTGGGIIGFSYKVNDRVALGLGVGAMSQIEDDVAVFPIVVVRWKIDDQWSLRTGGGVGASGGGSAEVVWEFSQGWEIAFGAGYQSRRFRLDDEDIAPDGVGDESTLPIYLRVGYSPHANVQISAVAGIIAAGELRLEDRDGDRVADDDIDPAPFIGVRASLRF
ncbi:MAG: hypothetical protein ACR2GY_08565 [Phycisphaerales bacterium]